MPKKIVIFDADGTLANTNHQFVAAYSDAFQKMGVSVNRDRLLYFIGMGHDQAIPRLTSQEWYDRHGEKLAETAESIYLQTYLKRSRLFPGAREIVGELKAQGFTVALASSSQRVIIDHYLTLFPEGRNTFSAIVTYDDVTHSKPDPELFLMVIKKLNANPKHVCAVGDSVWDMQAALRACIDPLAVLSGGTSENDLRQHGAKEVYRDIQDLRERVNKSIIFRVGY